MKDCFCLFTQTQISMCILSPSPHSSHLCLFILLRELVMCVCCSVCSEGAAGASAVVSSDSSTAYGRALWRMGAVTRQSAYPPTEEASHTNTMRKRRKQLNISAPLIYSPTATSPQERGGWGALQKRPPTGKRWPRCLLKCISVNHIKDRIFAEDKPSERKTVARLQVYTCRHWSSYMHSSPFCVSHRGA